MLNTLEYGTLSDRPSILIVHGLYGSARNWGVICKRLSDQFHLIAVDHRNHGDSPWNDSHTYHDLAADLAEVIEQHGTPMQVMGHSMGGKAAMVLALTRPELVTRLVVADIAPVTYSHDQTQFIEAMKAVDLDTVSKRSDAVAQLASRIDDPALHNFFTQSLDVANKRWKLNLDVLQHEMAHIIGFPDISGTYNGPTLFLSGSESHYILAEYRPKIKTLFPNASFAKIRGAGHWLHAEKPREFEAVLRSYFSHTDDAHAH
jgi:pimeloyl-ACP methyl ester carboxylesterase